MTAINRSEAPSRATILQTTFPPAFGYEGLAQLLGRTVATLQADRCRRPTALPPACTPPGTKSPRWLLADVLEWLSAHREVEDRTPADVPVKRGRGRPSKVETVEARALKKKGEPL